MWGAKPIVDFSESLDLLNKIFIADSKVGEHGNKYNDQVLLDKYLYPRAKGALLSFLVNLIYSS